jgi:hypothetical protein
MEESKKISDNCPDWAAELINEIVAIEIELGNIIKETDWAQIPGESLVKRTFGDASTYQELEERVEILFQKLSKALTKDGFDPEAIATFINVRATSQSSRLPYCNADEVTQAISK